TLIRATDRAFGVIARPGRGTAFVRRRARPVIGSLAPRLLASRLGPYLAGQLGQYRIRYHAVAGGEPSPRWARDRAVGLRLPPTAENAAALRSLSWQLHSCGIEVARPACAPEWIEGPFSFPPDPRGRLRRDRLYLVRPDGYVAASFPVHAGAVAQADVREGLAAYEARPWRLHGPRRRAAHIRATSVVELSDSNRAAPHPEAQPSRLPARGLPRPQRRHRFPHQLHPRLRAHRALGGRRRVPGDRRRGLRGLAPAVDRAQGRGRLRRPRGALPPPLRAQGRHA